MIEFGIQTFFKSYKEYFPFIYIVSVVGAILFLLGQNIKIRQQTKQIKASPPKADWVVENIDNLKSHCYYLPDGTKAGFFQDTVQQGGLVNGQMVQATTQYALAPTILLNDDTTQTYIIGNFYKTGSINHPLNPLYKVRDKWELVQDWGKGCMLYKKK